MDTTTATITTPAHPLPNGTIVTYNGSVASERGATLYVHRYEPSMGCYDLGDPADTSRGLVLLNAGQNSIQPTGEMAVFCRCGHGAHQHERWTCQRGTCAACR